jgi:hypothetical protein
MEKPTKKQTIPRVNTPTLKTERAATAEAETWHKLWMMTLCDAAPFKLKQTHRRWSAAREQLADALKLTGEARCRAPLIYRAFYCEIVNSESTIIGAHRVDTVSKTVDKGV